jgi:uncharacterized protein (TIGR02453 family)
MNSTNAFSPETVAWLVGIGENNTRAWFADHRDAYEAAVKGPLHRLLTELSGEFGGTPYLFRPNRDVRFSRDKSLYKTNVSGYLDWSGNPARYVEFSLNGLFAATGYYFMDAVQLERYRQALTGPRATALGTELREALVGREIGGDELKTAPRGIDREHENIDLLRRKSIVVKGTLPIEDAFDFERATAFVRDTWKAGTPLNEWLDRHVGPGAPPEK